MEAGQIPAVNDPHVFNSCGKLLPVQAIYLQTVIGSNAKITELRMG
jgi:hypothetical protein